MKNSANYFCNRDCPAFPCHPEVNPQEFNCFYCFCPMYILPDCPGNPSFTSNNVKDCSRCTLNHRPDFSARVGRYFPKIARAEQLFRATAKTESDLSGNGKK